MKKEETFMRDIPGFAFGRAKFFSDGEMTRRLKAVCCQLEKVKADALILFRPAGYTSPWLLWLTGARETCQPDAFIVKDGELYQTRQSGFLTDVTKSPYIQGNEDMLKNLLSGSVRLAFVGLGELDYGFHEFIGEIAPEAELIDFTVEFEKCRAVKSDEELDAIMESVRLHDKVFRCLPDFVYPGRRERDIASDILSLIEREGADFSDFDGIIPQTVYIEMHTGLGPAVEGGSVSQSVPIKWPGQIITESDWFQLCMHGHSVGGYVAQKSRNVYFSQPEDAAYQYFDYCVKAQDFASRLIKPGAELKKVKDEVNAWLQDALGCQPNEAGFVRGMGSFWSEQPNMDSDRCPVIEENMVYMMQPRITKNGYTDMCQETFVVRNDGSHCVSEYPRELIVLV